MAQDDNSFSIITDYSLHLINYEAVIST